MTGLALLPELVGNAEVNVLVAGITAEDDIEVTELDWSLVFVDELREA